MRRNETCLLLTLATLVFSSSVLLAEAKITVFYDKNPAEKKLQFRCMTKGLEPGKNYIIAIGAVAPIVVKGSIETPEGAQILTEPRSYVEKDISRINAGIKEVKAEGFKLTVKQVSPEAELRARFEIAFEEIEKLKTANSALFLYISREFSPNLFYIVDYYDMLPAKLLP